VQHLALRQHPELRNILVVMLTTSARERDVAECWALRARDVSCKPNTGDAMVALGHATA
jgi:CheY-like chemotaxis protein